MPRRHGSSRLPGVALSVMLVALAATARPVHAQGVEAALQAKILLKALTYDNNLSTRVKGVINIACLHMAGNAASKTCADAMLKAFADLGGMTVASRKVNSFPLEYSNKEAFRKESAARQLHVVYVCGGVEPLTDIMAVTREHKIISVGSSLEQVEQGVTFGQFIVDGRPRIVVNQEAAHAEGVDFRGALLRYAHVIKRK